MSTVQTGFYGWRLLAAFWLIMLINLAFPAYGAGVINAYMAADLGLDRKMLGLPYSVYMIMSGLPGPLVAVCVNRVGVRLTLFIGSLLVLTGSLAMALFVTSGIQAALAFGLMVGTGVATGGALASQAGVATWFVRKRDLALAILYSSGGIGGFIAAPLLNRIITLAGGNWRAGWWLVGGLAIVSAVVALVFVRERPSDLGQRPDGDTAEPSRVSAGSGASRPRRVHITGEEWTYREAVRTPAFWLMMFAFVGGSAGFTLFMAHGVVHLQDLGHSAAAAAWSLGILTGSTLLGKVVLGLLGDRVDPRYIWASTMASFGLGLVLVVNARSTVDLYAFAMCIGYGFGGGVVCMMAVLSNYYGTRVFASIAGLAVAINTTLSAIAPFVAGRVYDQIGSYTLTFYTLAAWCFAGVLILILVRPPHRSVVPVATPTPEAAIRTEDV